MSEKPLTAALKAETQLDEVNPIWFIEAEFPSPTGTVRVCSLGGGYFKWDSYQWQGLGGAIGISPITETTDVRAQSYKVRVNLFDGSWFDPTKLSNYNGNSCKLWFACYDRTTAEDTSQNTDPRLIADPYLMVDGFLDEDETTEDGKSGSLEFTVIDRLETMNRKRQLRYTHEQQKMLFPSSNDRGLEYIPQLQDQELKWGNA